MYKILNESKKIAMDADSKQKSNNLSDYTMKLLSDLSSYLLQKQFTNASEANMILGLGEKYFYKSNVNSKKVILNNFTSIFGCENSNALRDLAFYKNDKSFLIVNTNEDYIMFFDNNDEKNVYHKILDDLRKLEGMQIIDSYTISVT